MKFTIELRTEVSATDIYRCVNRSQRVVLSDEVKAAVKKGRSFLDDKLSQDKSMYYGINTGFGDLCNVRIEPSEIAILQENLVESHACGMGSEISKEVVKTMLLLKIISLSKGHSGISIEVLERLVFLFNEDINPIVYEYGSLGASGDLAPLAHLALPLIGKGEVEYKNTRYASMEVLELFGLEPLKLKSKEGLALLNGTQFMLAFSTIMMGQFEAFFKMSLEIAAMSLDAYSCKLEPFSPEIHRIRPHLGQNKVAEEIRSILLDSEISTSTKEQIQDPYSFRCIPQVHGACYDAIQNIKAIIETEINSVTDNPNIFPDEDKILTGGNFHGEPLALSLDFLAISFSELGSISERRVFKLVSGTRNLPSFLVKNSGINSGFMIPQYTAASIASANKQLSTPASVDSIDSSNGQEDHVSMGANAAVKAYKVFDNLFMIYAIEALTAAQALEFRRPLKSSAQVEKLHHDLRAEVSFMEKDRVLHDDMMAALSLIKAKVRSDI